MCQMQTVIYFLFRTNNVDLFLHFTKGYSSPSHKGRQFNALYVKPAASISTFASVQFGQFDGRPAWRYDVHWPVSERLPRSA